MDSSITIRLPNIGISEERERTCEYQVSDETLLKEICLGSKEALAVLFRRNARLVRGVALRVLKDPSEADDLVQDVFILIHRLCRTFDSSKASAQFWILQMTYRRAISRRRYLNSRHFYTQLELDEQADQFAEFVPGQFDNSANQILAELDLKKLLGPSRKTNRGHSACTSSKATRWMRLRRCLVRPKATSGTIPSEDWNGCENRFLVANCRAREQYDRRFVQARSRGVA